MGDEVSRATLSVWGGEDGQGGAVTQDHPYEGGCAPGGGARPSGGGAWPSGDATQVPVVFSAAFGYPDVES